jgi:hypothetical protein
MEYDNYKQQKDIYLNDLEKIIINSNDHLEGNSFYHHLSLTPYPELYNKQVNLFNIGKNTSRICEIGFNAGHSAMLLLLGRNNAPLNFTVFDNSYHRYTIPAFHYIKSQFPNVSFEYIEGDSTLTMPQWIERNQHLLGTYDLVHVDGGHSPHCITNDMKNSDLLVKINGFLIVDDVYMGHINDCVNEYISSGRYIDTTSFLPTYGYTHRIIQKIK